MINGIPLNGIPVNGIPLKYSQWSCDDAKSGAFGRRRSSFTAENLFTFSFLFFPLFTFLLFLFLLFSFFTFSFFTLFCFLLYFTSAPWKSLQWFVGTTSDNTWVILQITSMGLCICTYYCLLNVHIQVYYIHDIRFTSHTPVWHRASIKMLYYSNIYYYSTSLYNNLIFIKIYIIYNIIYNM